MLEIKLDVYLQRLMISHIQIDFSTITPRCNDKLNLYNQEYASNAVRPCMLNYIPFYLIVQPSKTAPKKHNE